MTKFLIRGMVNVNYSIKVKSLKLLLLVTSSLHNSESEKNFKILQHLLAILIQVKAYKKY
jgi:hypothetical protein